MHSSLRTGLVWFRRDLRLDDNAALATALQCCATVYCVFVFDKTILAPLPQHDRRVEFIHASVRALDATLRACSHHAHVGLIVLHDEAHTCIPALARALGVDAVFAARDYEPAARQRDANVQAALEGQGQRLVLVKDHVIWEEREVLTQTGKPYGVFTPYCKAWLAQLELSPPMHHVLGSTAERLAPFPADLARPLPSLQDLGFAPTNLPQLALPAAEQGAQQLLDDFWERMDDYGQTRDFPAIKGPSYLGVHLRFGTVSIRRLVALALQRKAGGSTGAAVWLNELAWRDFYFQILANFPHVAHGAFKPEYDQIIWESGEHAHTLFSAWCAGQTGYPLVDAAMAQINQTGYMHNRLRMVAGSFLVKHLGIDWRWGERYFAEHLNDFDQSANNGGWQWVASSGCDAQPYFRIFNPITQSEKFDPDGKFIRRYLPQLGSLDHKYIHAPWKAPALSLQAAGVRLGDNYPHPIVDHATARAATLQRYAVVRKAT